MARSKLLLAIESVTRLAKDIKYYAKEEVDQLARIRKLEGTPVAERDENHPYVLKQEVRCFPSTWSGSGSFFDLPCNDSKPH